MIAKIYEVFKEIDYLCDRKFKLNAFSGIRG